MYKTIDATLLGDVKWQSFATFYTDDIPPVNLPAWMQTKYDVWFKDPQQVIYQILGNPSFTDEIDLVLFREYSTDNPAIQGLYVRQLGLGASGESLLFDFRSLFSHKSRISSCMTRHKWGSICAHNFRQGTGNNEYYPLYLSIGNIHNNVRYTHRDTLVLVGFLTIPKSKFVLLDHCQYLFSFT
jgi:hypothetical protein